MYLPLPPLPAQPIPLCVALLVIVAASTDITARRIPNIVVATGLAVALLVQCAIHGAAAGALLWLTGAATGFALLLPFYLLRGMAAGDVKLMMTVGAWVGPALAFHIALAAFITGGIGSVALVVYRGRARQLASNLRAIARNTSQAVQDGATGPRQLPGSVGTMPYGVAIAAGTLGMLFATVA